MGPDGSWNLAANGTIDAGARLNAALDPILDQLFRAARTDGRREPPDAYAFDALIELAQQARSAQGGAGPGAPAHDGDLHGGCGGDGNGNGHDMDRREHRSGAGDGASGMGGGRDRQLMASRSARSTPPTHLAVLRLDLEALTRGAVHGDERCEIAGLGPIPVRVARQLLGRGPTAAQRIALLWTAPGCTVAGCHSTHTQIDHRVPWADTRHTRLHQLDRLCTHHHRLKTHDRWALTAGTGRRPIVPPTDPRHPEHRPVPP